MSKLRFLRLAVCSLTAGTEDDAAGMLNVFHPCAGRKKRRASRQSTDLGPLPSSAENPMAIMSYQPMDEQLNTQFLNQLSDHDNNGGLQPLRNPNSGGVGKGLSPQGLPQSMRTKAYLPISVMVGR